MSTELPAIIKAAELLLETTERTVAGFPRAHRYQLGNDLRKLALDCALLAQQALLSRATQLQSLQRLAATNDRLKLLLQAAHRLQCFRSGGQFEVIAEQARAVGRQCGALLKAVAKHPHGQNAGACAPPAASRDTEYSRRPTGAHV